MTSHSAQPISLRCEPLARWAHCSACINGKQYTYGGKCGASVSTPTEVVETFDIATETWQQVPTSGQSPSGYIRAACAVVDNDLFHFGGHDYQSRYYNTIHHFETKSFTWSSITALNPHKAPMPKSDAGMLVSANILAIAGGYGYLPKHPSSGSQYLPDQNSKYEEEGWTNEFHCFNVISSELC